MPLSHEERVFRCTRNHSFDIARSGYVNLLQPQDRRSRNPGDSSDSARARRRLFDLGHGSHLHETLMSILEPVIGAPGSVILDVGCGEGTHLAALATRFRAQASGTDISTAAIDLAAKRHPAITWVVANSDRFIPYPDTTFDAVLSITSRRNASEFRRILKPDGMLIVAVPAPEDLIEIRAAVLGEALERSRVESVVAELEGDFTLVNSAESREARVISKEEIGALLLTTYRGARKREMEVAASLETMNCTSAFDVLAFKKTIES